MDYRTRRSGALLEVVMEGRADLEAARLAYSALLEECRSLGIARMLIDCRPLRGGFSAMQRYEFGLLVADLHGREGPHEVRVALLGNTPLVDPGRLGELVAVNRGAPVRVVVDAGEGYRFLGVNAAGEPQAAGEAPD